MEIYRRKRRATIKEAAPILGLSEYALRQGVKKGIYPHIKVGIKYLVDIDLMTRLLEREAYESMNAPFVDN